MKTTGVILILVGLISTTSLITGFFAWSAPAAAEATPAGSADSLSIKMIGLSIMSLVCTGAGASLVFRCFSKKTQGRASD
jgi:hypothetical protein